MTQKELLEKAIDLGYDEEYPLFRGFFIIQQRKLHDSGYRQMYVIGHTDYIYKLNDYEYYLIATYSDVISFGNGIDDLLKGNKFFIKDLSMDINKNGIIHLWSRRNKFKVYFPHTSTCMLEIKEDNQ